MIRIKTIVLIWWRWGESLAFFLRSKKNRCIRQCLHWLMQAPQGLADMIRFPSTPNYTK